MSGDQRGSLVSDSDVANAVASRMRVIGGVKIVSYAVDDGNAVTFLLANGQQFRIGEIEEVKGEIEGPREI